MKRKSLLSGVSVALVLVTCVVYIFSSVLETQLLTRPTTITVEMPRSGGLYEGSVVAYRGVKVGKVSDLRLGEEGVLATIELTSDRKIPRDSVVKVRSLSPVGEQYIDFQPRTDSGPYLEDGARIPGEAVDLPQGLAVMATTLSQLIDQIEPDKVKVALHELSTGLDGISDDLRQLVDQGGRLVETLDANYPLTDRLLRNANVVLKVGADEKESLVRAAASAKTFAAWLREFEPELFRLIDHGPAQVEELRAMVKDFATTLPSFFDTTGQLTDILNARDPHLRELFIRYAPGIGALAATFQGDAVALNFVLKHGEQCIYGVKERSPRDTTYRPMERGGHCSRDLKISQRGAQWAPPPLR